MSQRISVPSAAQRLASMFVDHVIMTFSIAFGCLLISLPMLLFTTNKITSELDIFEGGLLGLMAFGIFSIYFNKDILNGQSPAKRILRLQVVDNETNEVAKPLQCLLRNITIIIWPLEVLITLFNPSRRLGDLLANTKVVILDETKEKASLDKKEILKALLAGLVLLAILFCLSLLLQSVFL